MNHKIGRVLEEIGWCAHVVILVNTVAMMMEGGWLAIVGGISGICLILLFRTIDLWDLKK